MLFLFFINILEERGRGILCWDDHWVGLSSVRLLAYLLKNNGSTPGAADDCLLGGGGAGHVVSCSLAGPRDFDSRFSKVSVVRVHKQELVTDTGGCQFRSENLILEQAVTTSIVAQK